MRENQEASQRNVHGHEVLEMMLGSGVRYTRAELCRAIRARFGEDTRFYTCSAEDLNAEELVEFLAAKGKFVETRQGWTTEPERICRH